MGPIIAKFFWVPSYKKKSQTKEETITSMHCKVISFTARIMATSLLP
ncbi:Uncharacterised protein [Escherichia coli]|nr:Uncharacterised protein [Escherichia coli]